jgi:hypothetical protein
MFVCCSVFFLNYKVKFLIILIFKKITNFFLKNQKINKKKYVGKYYSNL